MLKYFIFLLFISCSATSRVNFDKEKQELLELEQKQREYHFKKNAKAITELSSDDFIIVDNGAVNTPKREDQLKMFTNYFNAVEFIKWDDKKPPVIRFSKDASVAYVSLEKLVILKSIGRSGKEVTDTTEYAWISIYKKTKKGWELDALASTRMAKN